MGNIVVSPLAVPHRPLASNLVNAAASSRRSCFGPTGVDVVGRFVVDLQRGQVGGTGLGVVGRSPLGAPTNPTPPDVVGGRGYVVDGRPTT